MHSSSTQARAGALVLLALLTASPLQAQAPASAATPLTLEWIFGPEGRGVERVPAFMWLNDGSAVMLDTRRPEAEQTFERIDPATGARRPALVAATALANLKALLPDTKLTALPWPDATFDAALSTSAIHHGLRANILRTIDEVWRLLKPGGLFLADFPSTDRAEYADLRAEVAAGHILEVEPNTFVDERPDSEDADGFLPHHFCDEAEVRDLLRRFTLERVWLGAGTGGRSKWVAWARKEA